MSNLYQFLEKTKKKNIFLEDKNILENKLFLLSNDEINLFKRDRKTFENFYGESATNALSKSIKNKTNDQFFNLFEVRSGKLKYLIAKTEDQIEKAKKEKNKVLLESELKKLKKRERRLFLITNEKIKNYYSFNEAKEDEENKKESFLDRGLKKFENLTSSILKTATSKINYKKNSKLTIAIKLGARIISMLYAYNAISGLAATMGAIAPILGTTVIVAVCSFILFLIALKTPTALNFLRLILNKNKEIISKTLGIPVEEITGFSDNVKGLASKFDKIIKEYKIKAKKVLVDGVLKKINLAFKKYPKVYLGLIIAFFRLKLIGIFKNPVTFLIQFFSGMLFKSCTSITDGFIAVYDKFKKEKEGVELVKSVWSTFHGFEVPQKILDTFFADEVKPKDQNEKPKDQETEVKIPENASFAYQFDKQLQSYYYEYINNNIISNSVFFKEQNLFYEAEQTQIKVQTTRVDKNLLKNIRPDMYSPNKVEVTQFSLRKNNFKANILVSYGRIYLLENKKLKKSKEEIEVSLKTMGISEEELVALKVTTDYIELNDNNFEILKNLFINYSGQKTAPTEQTQDTKEQQENKGNAEEQEGNKTEETNIDNASKLLNDNNILYIPITQDSAPENLIIVKDKPSDENILGYIEMNKSRVEKNNYRFNGSIYVKKAFDYPSNKLVSTLFEEEQPEIKNFVNITKEPALISIRVDKGKYVINSGKFLGMFGEKSKKGKLNETFFDYVRFGIKKLKSDYMNKYDLEIKKLDQKQKNELDQKINDILFNFDKTDNFTIKSDLLKERKKQELEKIIFTQFEKEKTPETEEKPAEKIDKNKILREKELYINIPDEKTKIDISDLQLSTEKPIDGIGYVKLIKKDNDNFDASFFVKRAFNYQKNNFLKTIFEQEQEENLPESEIEKIDYIDVTGEPAEVEIELIDDKFAVSQKGGFLGFNKKITKIGKVNDNYKEYINNIIPQIEREISKNKIDKNDPDIQDKIKDISSIDFKGDIKKVKDEKVNEILSKTETDSIENAEKEAKEKNIPFISSRNAIALGLFSFVSALAIYWHGTGKSVAPESAMLIYVLEGTMKASEAAEKIDFNQVTDRFDPQTQIEGVADAVAPDTGNLSISDDPNDLKEVLDSPALKNAENALGNVSQETIDNADAGSGGADGDSNAGDSGSGSSGGEDQNSGSGGNKTILDTNQKEEFVKSYDKDFKTIVNKDEVFEKIKASWVASHPNSGIKIEDIKPGSELYMKLNNFTDKVIGSVESIKDQPDGFYTKTPSLIAAINKDPSNAINAIKDKLDISIEKGWTANQIASIKGDVTVPEVDKPIPQEVIQNTPEPIKPILIVDPPKEPASITDPIPKIDDTTEPSKPATPKTPDTGDETIKPTTTTSDVKPEEPKPVENTDQKTNPETKPENTENPKPTEPTEPNNNEPIKPEIELKPATVANINKAIKNFTDSQKETLWSQYKSYEANIGDKAELSNKKAFFAAINKIIKDQNVNIEQISDSDMEKISPQLFKDNIKPSIWQNIKNIFKSNDSYEYESDDEKFLMNEYFKFEESLNKWKRKSE